MAALSQIITASYPAVLAASRKPEDQWSENAALRMFDKYGFIEKKDLGATIEVPLDIEANDEAGFQTTDLDAADLTTKTEVLGGASYAIAEISVPVKWTKKDEAMNPSVNQKVALVKALLENGFNSHDDVLEQAVMGGTTSGFLGLGTLAPDTGQGTVGGIDASTETYWRSQVGTPYEADGSNIEAIFTQVWNACIKGTGSPVKPKLLLGGAEAHGLYEGQLADRQRYVDTQDFRGGAKMLAFKDAFFGFSPYGDDHVWFLTPRAVKLIMSKQFNRHKGEVQEQDARNSYILKVYTALQMVALNRSRLGVAYQET